MQIKTCYFEKSNLNKDQTFMNCCGNGDINRKKKNSNLKKLKQNSDFGKWL